MGIRLLKVDVLVVCRRRGLDSKWHNKVICSLLHECVLAAYQAT